MSTFRVFYEYVDENGELVTGDMTSDMSTPEEAAKAVRARLRTSSGATVTIRKIKRVR